MILRKPYAFLVKHFRLIHLVLLALMIYVFTASKTILDFLNQYVGSPNSYYDYEQISSTLGGLLPVFTAFLVIAICGVLIYLLWYKKKPITFYIIIAIMHIIMLLEFIIMPSFVYGMAQTVPSQAAMSIIKDLFLISAIADVVFMIMTFTRAIGFDFKKFDFKKDVQELGIEEDDNAEFEFEFNFDKDDIITKIRKRLRYVKYFYRENKKFFYVGYAAAIIFLIVQIFNFFTSLEHVYRENESYKVGRIQYTVLKSYNTVLNSKGNRINDKYFYTIVKIKAKNVSSSQAMLNTNNISLYYTSSHSVNPNTKVYDYFKEYGIQYYNQILSPGQTRTFILIFESPIEYYSRLLKLRTLESLDYKEDKTTKFNFKTVRLSPVYDSDKTKKVDEKKLNEELVFKDSMLGNTSLTIKKAELADSFGYNVKHCIGTKCDQDSRFITASNKTSIALTVMRLEYDLKLDYKTLGQGYTANDFIARYGKIRYYIKGVKNDEALDHNIVVKDLTPVYTNKISFIEVKNILKRATKVYLDFVIKDKEYSYLIIDNTNKEKTESVDLPIEPDK